MTITISPRGSGAAAVSRARVGSVAAPHLLVELGELAADRGLARPQPLGEVGERRRQPRAGLEQHERGRNAVELGNARAPRRLLRGQKSLEEEPVGRQRAHHQRRKHGGRAGQGRHARALLACRAHELVAGVGDQRGAGIGDERDGCALGEPCQQLGPGLGGVVVVIGRERGGDGVMVDELAGDPGVLAGDHVGRGQDFQRPHGDVAQVSDRGSDQVQAGSQRRRGHRLAMEDVAPAAPVAGRPGGRSGGRGRPHAAQSSRATGCRHRWRKKSLSFSFG